MKLHYAPNSEFKRILSLKGDDVAKTKVFSDACRLNTLYMIMRAGSGHIGSSFSAMDIVSWLYVNEMRAENLAEGRWRDIYFSSKGHDAPGYYAILIALERLESDLIHKLRQLGGLPGHPDVSLPGMEANTGSLGMGVSKAKGMVTAARIQGKKVRAFVLTGDGELQEGQIWESLQGAANRKMGEITVIVDHNKIQSDTWVEKVSPLGDLEKKFAAYGWEVSRCDGNDPAAFSAALAKVNKAQDKPKVIIADTVKGKGVSFMEMESVGAEFEFYNFHSGAPSDGNYEKGFAELLALVNGQLKSLGGTPLQTLTEEIPDRVPPVGQRMVKAYSKALLDQAEKTPNLVALDADLMLDTGLVPFHEKYPERFIECGIAEMDMVSQAGGFALKGMLPICHSFACFLSTRPNEQIFTNATEKSKVIYVGSLAGLVPSAPGHSHQSVRDISCLAGVPGLILLEPCEESEVGLLLDYCVNQTEKSSYLRLVSVPCDIPYALPKDYVPVYGQGVTLNDGRDAILFGYGPVMLTEAYKAAGLLKAKGIGLKVVNLPWLNHVDAAWLKKTVAGHGAVFTLDNHYLIGGQGQIIRSALAGLGLAADVRVVSFGVTEIPRCGQNAEVIKAHALDAESLAERIASAVRAR
ncbi:MAG TPA: transketolase C-terminal domain-containing protein [Fibrobacteria bacterium]|nr:transketolase C-terminal domain-containing protein [Fibrobacteria bacterium]